MPGAYLFQNPRDFLTLGGWQTRKPGFPLLGPLFLSSGRLRGDLRAIVGGVPQIFFNRSSTLESDGECFLIRSSLRGFGTFNVFFGSRNRSVRLSEFLPEDAVEFFLTPLDDVYGPLRTSDRRFNLDATPRSFIAPPSSLGSLLADTLRVDRRDRAFFPADLLGSRARLLGFVLPVRRR